ncbi:phosphoadenylyl-sulfate reductase [Ornithinicoccus halotolerans]|uniref:phosphoadenylyl-sulfate reductase n=1 Tax=Ornithinicoccus halotolerans TaxID=1748220 RepID=UPI001294E2F3|nr:phosphoadenylyl-sulfate reductase [Ornithinicoccus halotolerans]
MTATSRCVERTELAARAREAAARFARREQEVTDPVALSREVVAWAVEAFGDRLAVTSSMADGVTAHLVCQRLPGVDVLFLDTGYHFAQTLQTRDQVARSMPVTVRTIEPRQTVAEQDREHGRDLFARDPEHCCLLRKVEPLSHALAPYDAWVTGLRREDSPARAATPLVAWDADRGMVKVSPVAHWTQPTVEAYVAEHEVPVNLLLEQGYPSIGCFPCTRRPLPGQGSRSGRWTGFDKTECGIHP